MGRGSWLITFADLSAVLCAFFVLMLAMSEFDTPALDRIASIFGRAQGDWVRIETETERNPAIERSGEVRDVESDYLAALMKERIARADWPWSVDRRPEGLVLTQAMQPSGPVVPDEFAQFLASIGGPLRVLAVLDVQDKRHAASIGAFDEGLRAAGELAERLARRGVGENIPAGVRLSLDKSLSRLEIILDSGTE